MSMLERRVSTKIAAPAPPNFRANFEKGGWRLVERLYGARTDRILAWMTETGCRSRRTAVTQVTDGGRGGA